MTTPNKTKRAFEKFRGEKLGKKKRNRKASGVYLVIFFSIFLIAGCAFLYFAFIIPTLKSNASKSWPAVDCTILTSEVGKHRSDDGTSYSVDITFAYEYKGNQYESDTYEFFRMSTSGYDSKKRIVGMYPSGSRQTCYVNPDDPTEAVIERKLGNAMFFGLIPLVFVLVGLGGIYGGIRTIRKSKLGISEKAIKRTRDGMIKEIQTDDYLPDLPESNVNGIELKANQKPLGTFIAVSIFAIIWNGFIGVMCFKILGDFGTSSFDWLPALFLTPFVLIGLGIIAFAVYQFLAMFNPWPIVLVNTPYVAPGESFELEWQFAGRVNRIKSLKVFLKAQISATYQAGKNQSTKTKDVHQQLIYDSDDAFKFVSGMIDVKIPDNAMHSLNLKSNKVKWRITIEGDIPKWPDVDLEFPVVVVPKGWEPSK